MNLGENIYRLRTERNMSQGDLADALEVSRQSVSKWENNSATPELDKLMKMSQLFDITLDELISGTAASAPKRKTVSSSPIPPRKIVGAILLFAAFLTFLTLTAMGGIANGSACAIPFALCGITCFVFRRHVGVWCAWALYLPLVLITNPDYLRADIGTVARIFVQIPILLYTVLDFRPETLLLTPRTKTLLFSGYVFWLLYIAVKLACHFTLNGGLTLHFWLDYLAFALFCALLSATVRLIKANTGIST